MIYVFYGPNAYQRLKKLREFLAATSVKYPEASIEHFSIDEEGEIGHLYDFISPQSLFEKSKRIAIINGSDGLFDDDVLSRIISLSLNNSDSVLVFNENWKNEKMPSPFSSTDFIKNIHSYYFGSVSDREMLGILTQEIKSKKIEIESLALNYLFEVLGRDPFAVINEVDKLSFLKKPITRSLVGSMDEYWQERGVYDFSHIALKSGSLKEKLFLWEQLLHQKTDDYMILNYLAKSAGTLDVVRKLCDVDLNIKKGLSEPSLEILNLLLS